VAVAVAAYVTGNCEDDELGSINADEVTIKAEGDIEAARGISA
jgi:hypothetical protein